MKLGNRGALRRVLASSAACGVLLFAGSGWAQAVSVDVAAQPLGAALRELGKETGVNILFSPASVAGRQAVAVKGDYTPLEAARRLAAQSDLDVVEDGSGALIVRSRTTAVPTSGGAPSVAPVPEGVVDEFVVTGSRLRQTTFESLTPTVDLGREDILESGYGDLGEALSDLPGVDVGVNLTTSQSSVQDNGLSTISLRSLGENRTLTLIDGRRTVSNAGNRNTVSLSSIPEFFVDRVEITTGGASAIYGSDAVSGVVNVITESKMDGVRARVVAGTTDAGGGSTIEYSAAAGGRFVDDRLYVMVGATYERQNALKAAERDRALRSVSYSSSTNTLSGPDLSTYIPGGRFRASNFYFDDTGLHSGFVTAVNGYDTRQNGTLITPAEYTSGAIKLSFDVNDNLKFWGQFLGSRVETDSTREAYALSNTITFGVNDEFSIGNIARSNPFVHPTIYASSSASISFRRRMTEVGPQEIYNRRTTLRGWVGAEGTVFGSWDWFATYGYGEFDGFQSRNNGLNLQNVKYALDAETVGGVTQCKSAVARADGCVPLNLFGIGAITPEMANYVRANVWYRPKNRLDTFEAYATGTLFQMPAGPVETAFGFEVRREKTGTTTDVLTQNGLTNYAYIPEYAGKIEAQEAFFEVSVPLLRDMPMAYRLEVDGAVRFAHYNLDNVDTTASYRLGLQWAPVEDLRFRAALSRAQRAPDTSELYSPPRDDFETVTDLCSGVTAATTGQIAQNCRLDPGVASAIANGGVFVQTDFNFNNPNGGNANLSEETADTLTLGLVYQPRFVPGLEVSLDYYDIKVEGAISSLGSSDLLLECYSAANLNNTFCDAITRDADGNITRILNRTENLNDLRASGIDVALRYRFDLEQFSVPGDFTFKINYGHRLELEQDYDGVLGVKTSDYLGEVGTSKDEARVSLAWRERQWSAQWTTTYIGEAVDSNEMAAAFKTAGITDPLYLNVDAYLRHDISVKFYPLPRNKDLKIFGTVRNIFDNEGPFLPSGTDSGRSYNYNPTYGVTGRAYTLGIQLAF
jgi:iron complex outermembrane recepter protein